MANRNLLTFKKLKSFATVTSCSLGIFVGLNIYNQNEKFYNEILMPIVYKLPAEFSHRMAVLACKYKLFPSQRNADPESLKTNFLGHSLTNPIGIAAGFDKHAEAIDGLSRIGFGIIEIGSVTPLPQDGNPKPRVFRLVEDKAIINRYGFNSYGHDDVFSRLSTIKNASKSERLIGVNLGKNKLSDNAIADYVKGIETFSSVADYLVINVSSPNTPGLRDLQNKNFLMTLLSAVILARKKLSNTEQIPILLKLAPDLTQTELKDIATVLKRKDCCIDGIIISNTTVERMEHLQSEHKHETGGLSGVPLKDKSTEMISEMYRLTDGKIPIIGVGGIFSGMDAFEKILAGASAIQIYTSFIYHGPPIVEKIKRELTEILAKNGYENIADAVGASVKKKK